jgi:hypothetical protein
MVSKDTIYNNMRYSVLPGISVGTLNVILQNLAHACADI